jgi:2-keto-3-deoxy-L-rhamnonate aldolase RhmA
MNGSELNQALRSGDRSYGTLVTSASPHLAPRLRDVGLDFVFIDTEHIPIDDHDLSVSMEIPEQYDHPDFDKAVRGIISKARAKGVGAGIHFWADLEQEIESAKAGANLFLHSADVLLFAAALRKDLAEARSALGDAMKLGDEVVDPI